MNPTQALAYVKATSIAMALPLDDARAERVAAHLVLSCKLARVLEAAPLDVADEPAEVYRPAPFPAADTRAPA